MTKLMFFTGSRAEFGLLLPIIEATASAPDVDVTTVVSGSHLDDDYGLTIEEIRYHSVGRVLTMPLTTNGISSTMQADYIPRTISEIVSEFSTILLTEKPDAAVIIADRFESFGAMIAASQMSVPVVHIEGGDKTEGGALDDSVRHAMTKLAHIHCTTNEDASNRVLALGEEKWRIRNIGLPVLDLVNKGAYNSKQQVMKSLGLCRGDRVVVFTQHSITTDVKSTSFQINQSIEALSALAKAGIKIIVTYPNNDFGSATIVQQIKKISEELPIILVPSLGRNKYHGLLNLNKIGCCRVIVIGNSSSGIKEARYFECPVVNIGSRQQGRLRSINVVDVGYNANEIKDTAMRIFENFESTIAEIRKSQDFYWSGGAARKFLEFVIPLLKQKNHLIQKKITI